MQVRRPVASFSPFWGPRLSFRADILTTLQFFCWVPCFEFLVRNNLTYFLQCTKLDSGQAFQEHFLPFVVVITSACRSVTGCDTKQKNITWHYLKISRQILKCAIFDIFDAMCAIRGVAVQGLGTREYLLGGDWPICHHTFHNVDKPKKFYET